MLFSSSFKTTLGTDSSLPLLQHACDSKSCLGAKNPVDTSHLESISCFSELEADLYSSTKIRLFLKQEMSIKYLIHPAVIQVIYERIDFRMTFSDVGSILRSMASMRMAEIHQASKIRPEEAEESLGMRLRIQNETASGTYVEVSCPRFKPSGIIP